MRLVFRDSFVDPVWGDFNIFTNIAQVQTLKGITSKVGNKHFILWDIENVSLHKAVNVLTKIQKKWKLSNIYITSDKESSYHAFCYSLVSFKTMLKILLDSTSIIDWSFFVWTCHRKASTIRLSNKKNRPSQELVRVIRSYFAPIPKKVVKVIYDTGIEKYPEFAS